MPTPRVESRLQHASLSADLKGAFATAELYRVMFFAGHTLFKLSHEKAVNTRGSVHSSTDGRVTPWWFSLVVRLVRDAVGLVGTCSGQQHGTPPDAGGVNFDRVSWIGGARQIYLPGLTPHDVEVLEHGRSNHCSFP